jgi:predicted metal-dependent hydrolase
MHRFFRFKIIKKYRRVRRTVHGTELLYLGEPNPISFKNKDELRKWYKEKAKEILKERMEHYSNLTGWKYSKLSITNAQTRWGSCSHSNKINLSLRLMMLPIEIIDYVVYELAHIVEKNHKASFWNKVREVLPDYEERRKKLRSYEKRIAKTAK